MCCVKQSVPPSGHVTSPVGLGAGRLAATFFLVKPRDLPALDSEARSHTWGRQGRLTDCARMPAANLAKGRQGPPNDALSARFYSSMRRGT